MLLDQRDHEHSPGPNPFLRIGQSAGGVLASYVQVIEDHQGRFDGFRRLPHRRDGQGCRSASGPRIVDATAAPVDLRSQFRSQSGLADLGSPRNEDDPPASSSGRTPRAPQPMHLVLAID